MPKTPPPLLGFNNNVRHRGRVFHIQTEDSGVKRPHIITHLFADGGRIVNTAKTEYSEHVGRDDMATVVRRLMKEQHKAMFIKLRAGELDDRIDAACGPPPVSAVPASVTAATMEAAAGDLNQDALASLAPEPRSGRGALKEARASVPAETLPGVAASPGGPRPPSPSTAALHLPDPPSTPDDFAPDPAAAEAASSSTPATPSGQALSQPPPPPDERGGGRRYGPSRPAAIFADVPNPGSSIFGGSISEQSLDEVILSYLAEDLDDG